MTEPDLSHIGNRLEYIYDALDRMLAVLHQVDERTNEILRQIAERPRSGPDLVYGDPCPVCGQDGWPAGSVGNARRIHELDKHEGDPRIKPRLLSPKAAE